MTNLVDLFFGCWHKNYSFPITARQGKRRNSAAVPTGTYIVCLDCGKEFPYDWESMKVVSGNAVAHAPLAEAARSNAA